MKPSRNLMGVVAAALLLGGGVARAQSNEELKDEVKKLKAELAATASRLDELEVKTKDAVVAGDNRDSPGSFRVPGTELSLRFYGYAETNWIHELEGDNSDVDIPAFPAYAPVRGTDGAKRTDRDFITARTSRFGFDATQPTRFGALAVKLEGDFINEPRNGTTGQYGGPGQVITQQETSSYGFRMRHAYGAFAGLLIGQTWGTFMDVDNSPETVDYNGPPGSTIIRQPMIRYSYGTPDWGKFTVALENSSTYVLDQNGGVIASSLSRIPDVVVRWDGSYEWGNVSVRGLGQELRLKDPANGVDATKYGWGAAATTFIKVRDGADYLSLAVTGGDGIGRYLFYTEGALYDAAANQIDLEKAAGVVAGYQLKPTDWVRFNFVYGITRNFNNAYVTAARAFGLDSAFNTTSGIGKFAINRQVQQAHVGAIFTPIKAVDLGLEGIWGQRETLAGEHGDLLRFNFLARYYIN